MRTTAIIIFTACVLFVFCAVFSAFYTDGIAYAVLPASYSEDVSSGGLDWYFGEQYLDLAVLKETVNSWFSDTETYDFSSLEVNPIIVAVIDTGVNFTHEIFEGKYDADGNPTYGAAGDYDVLLRDEEGNLVCLNTVKNKSHVSTSVMDDSPNGHGTHVAGTIAILIHALNLEKYIKILPIKAAYPDPTVSDPNRSAFSSDSVDQAIEFALDKGASVVNMSFTLMSRQSQTSDSFGKLITDERADRAVFVGAAGNTSKASEGTLTWSKGYPAASTNVIGVMNATYGETGYEVYSTSNYGDAYDLVAPGFDIYSADADEMSGYKNLKGTSMATPFVSFGAALATLKYSAIASATSSENAKTPRQIAEIVKSSYKKTVVYKSKTLKIFDINVFAGNDTVYGLAVDFVTALGEQTLGDVKDVEFTASVIPSELSTDELLATVTWFLRDGDTLVEVGEGATFTFETPNAVGTYNIVARVTYEGNNIYATKTLRVNYVAPSKEDTKIAELGEAGEEDVEYVVGRVYHFSIDGYQSFDVSTTVIWYVDGEYAGSGFTFDFAPEEYGEYFIQAKVNGLVLNDAKRISVTMSRAQKERIYAYVSAGIFGGILFVAGIIALVYFLKTKKKKPAEA